MAILYFSDVLKKVGLNPAKVKLIRHAMSDPNFSACYQEGKVFEYTSHQKRDFSKDYEYWVTFISENGTTARLHSCYKVISWQADTVDIMPEGLPLIEQENYKGENSYFQLEYVELLKEYENRLTIEWGNAARAWHQKGTTEKEILAIEYSHKEQFPGFENIILDYGKLRDVIVGNKDRYENWYTAMSSVKAVYLIVDKETGKQYVGSAYGDDGLWGRWTCYVDTYHGGNKLMKELICNYPDRYQHFQFSVLQVLPMSMLPEEVIAVETLYKKKLLSYQPFGMNAN